MERLQGWIVWKQQRDRFQFFARDHLLMVNAFSLDSQISLIKIKSQMFSSVWRSKFSIHWLRLIKFKTELRSRHLIVVIQVLKRKTSFFRAFSSYPLDAAWIRANSWNFIWITNVKSNQISIKYSQWSPLY